MTTTSPPPPPIPPYLKNVKNPTSPSKVEVHICMDLRSDHKHDHDRIDYRRYLSDYHWVISMWKIQLFKTNDRLIEISTMSIRGSRIFFKRGRGARRKRGDGELKILKKCIYSRLYVYLLKSNKYMRYPSLFCFLCCFRSFVTLFSKRG